jgi:hypothetical protein
LQIVLPITKNMQARGGGITNIELKNKSEDLSQYFQLHATFETLDAMELILSIHAWNNLQVLFNLKFKITLIKMMILNPLKWS